MTKRVENSINSYLKIKWLDTLELAGDLKRIIEWSKGCSQDVLVKRIRLLFEAHDFKVNIEKNGDIYAMTNHAHHMINFDNISFDSMNEYLQFLISEMVEMEDLMIYGRGHCKFRRGCFGLLLDGEENISSEAYRVTTCELRERSDADFERYVARCRNGDIEQAEPEVVENNTELNIIKPMARRMGYKQTLSANLNIGQSEHDEETSLDSEELISQLKGQIEELTEDRDGWRADYERIAEANEALARRLDTVSKDNAGLERERDRLLRENNELVSDHGTFRSGLVDILRAIRDNFPLNNSDLRTINEAIAEFEG